MNRHLVLLATVLVLSCGTTKDGQLAAKNPCSSHTPPSSSKAPIICVDDRNLSQLTTNPYKVWAKKNAPIKWYTVTGDGGLSIAFQNDLCVKNGDIDCATGSRCDAKLTAAGSVGTPCKYTVTINRNGTTTQEDPIVIIDAGVAEEP